MLDFKQFSWCSIPATSTKHAVSVDQPRPPVSRLPSASQTFKKTSYLAYIGLFWPPFGHAVVTTRHPNKKTEVIHISTGEGELSKTKFVLSGGYVDNKQSPLLTENVSLNLSEELCLYLVTQAQSPMSETIKGNKGD